MKYVIRSLLLVNLLLQLTSALRKCFNQDENLMLTVILLAFSVIGIVGLSLNNRFILIIFAACITLICIASITIYVIARTEYDDSRPKVPRFMSTDDKHQQPTRRLTAAKRAHQNQNQTSLEARKSGVGSLINRLMVRNRTNSPRQTANKTTQSSNTKPLVVSTSLTDDYSDEGVLRHQSGKGVSAGKPVARPGAMEGEQVWRMKMQSSWSEEDEGDSGDKEDDGKQVVNEQWIAYERVQYQRYMNIISQSIDLILQTILAFWLALLLDDESDTCFGATGSGSGGESGVHSSKSGSHSSSSSSGATRRRQSRPPLTNNGLDLHHQEGPIYNYNGVRYSIRPDSAPRDSPSQVATIYR